MSNAVWTSRPLASGEVGIAEAMFSKMIDPTRVRILREKAMFFQPRNVTIAHDGNIWLHPKGSIANSAFATDLSEASLDIRTHLVHELTHVFQHQKGINLVLEKTLMFFRYGALGGYDYELEAGKPFSDYNIEQQACTMADRYRRIFEKELKTADSRI